MPRTSAVLLLLASLGAVLLTSCGGGDEVLVAMGTTVQDSGLLDALEPAFEERTGYELTAIAVGTGQALEMGRRGDADALFTHDPDAEAAFVAAGYGVNRRLVMHNDFVIVGPPQDPAGVAGAGDAGAAFAAIAEARAAFISRGDDSGTHRLERELWPEAGVDPAGEPWYEEAGQGMASTLQVASQRGAYALTDRGTFLSQRANVDLVVLFEGDPRFLNVYHVMQVNPAQHSDVNADGARAFVDFMVSDEAQAIIRAFGVEEFGRALFVPDAGKDEDELTLP